MQQRGNVVQIERVRCLECGATYTKPVDGGTVHENPGCPRCSYLGWITVSLPAAPAEPPPSAADLLRRPPPRRR